MTVTCLAFSGVIAEDGLDTQGLSVGPTAPIAGAWSWGRSELTARVPCRPLSTHSLARSMGSTFSGAYGNFACSFAATSQGSTPASSLSSYTFGTTPAATVLGASHALRPVCPLIFLRGS